MSRRARIQRGFTLIELMFAMTFLTILLIVALISSVNVMRTYNKGLVLKQVNQSGRAIGSEVQRSLKAAEPPIETVTVGEGRMCLGSYSYVWSIGGGEPYLYDNGQQVGFAKVSDSTRSMCNETRPTVPANASVELLEQDNSQVAIQNAELVPSGEAGGLYLYTFTFTIGTDDESLLTDERDACRTNGDQDFCALNRFSVVANARGV